MRVLRERLRRAGVGGYVEGTGIGALDAGSAWVNETQIDVAFALGRGRQIDQLIARQISAARRRIQISSMVLSSGTILGALVDAIQHDQVKDFGGIYLRRPPDVGDPQGLGRVRPVLLQVDNFRAVSARLVAKPSQPFNPHQPTKDYNFMHTRLWPSKDRFWRLGRFGAERSAHLTLRETGGYRIEAGLSAPITSHRPEFRRSDPNLNLRHIPSRPWPGL